MLGQISGMVAYQRPDNYVEIKPGIINGVTLEQVGTEAGRIRPDGLTWVVVGDLSKIEAPVRALHIGEVSVIDTDGHPVATKAAAATP